jgi:tetratricopeptide (TPR) repeat protein
MNVSGLSISLGSQEQNLKQTGRGLSDWAIGSISLILLYALSFSSEGLAKVVSIFSHGTLIAVAFGSVGSLIGFLFGIPRTLQSEMPMIVRDSDAAQPSGKDGVYRQAVNTNLEQISDWLTKILVGVGLTQLNQATQKLTRLAGYFQTGLNNSAAITLVVILNSTVFGFFAGYLLTRLFLASAFWTAQRFESLRGTEQFARGLTEAGAYGKAISTLEEALNQITPDTPKDVERRIYENLVYNYLYEPAPTGFQKAIEYGRAYIEQEPDSPSARIWAYLAAAYGQQYSWEVGHEKRQAVLDTSKRSALESIEKAVKIEPKMKSLLRTMWDPTDPTKEPSEENDLEVFYSDEDFKKLLG